MVRARRRAKINSRKTKIVSNSDGKTACYRFKICQSVTARAFAVILLTHITILQSMNHLFHLKQHLRSAPCTHSLTKLASSKSMSSNSSKMRRKPPILLVPTFISLPRWEPNNLPSWRDVSAWAWCRAWSQVEQLLPVAAVHNRSHCRQ